MEIRAGPHISNINIVPAGTAPTPVDARRQILVAQQKFANGLQFWIFPRHQSYQEFDYDLGKDPRFHDKDKRIKRKPFWKRLNMPVYAASTPPPSTSVYMLIPELPDALQSRCFPWQVSDQPVKDNPWDGDLSNYHIISS
ncbi:hypothetical protein ABW21_db0207465 [Orbilia brochopaga]|nr:hypothetical protein ABW21_db0207465 [Drechslerella brochopaga]